MGKVLKQQSSWQKQQQLPQLRQQLACQAIKMQKLPLTQAKKEAQRRKEKAVNGEGSWQRNVREFQGLHSG